ncbi:hypothetical protein SS50377_23110 [Spironucleus salmonicida]|uniref:Uncharacterized protein n=1 Tax=Spironucleus salmonicida TaxID=348837 RepID=V6LB98_9EUKA|nr:hypothetical protein SS50377_23110 [Spironucleus salmonicida]|eukprot:EST41715.1 Hypothetical protein SS50377_18801 [Spironucleus salmonicida]
MLGLFSTNFPPDAVKNSTLNFVKLVKIQHYIPGCVVLAPQLNQIFNTQSFATLEKQAKAAQAQIENLSSKITTCLGLIDQVGTLQEKREICLRILHRTRSNLNYCAMEAWKHTGVAIQDIISKDQEIYEQDRQMHLSQLLQAEEDELNKIREEINEAKLVVE